MTKERILKLAYERQREIWEGYYSLKQRCPDINENANKEAEAWKDLLEIERMMQKEMWGAERV